MRRLPTIAALLLAAAMPLRAATLYLSGTVGKAPVFVTVERSEGSIDGWYVYLRKGRQIRLEGHVDAGGALTLTEKDASTNAATGAFEGRIDGERWTGSWHKPGIGMSLPFALAENREPIAENARFHCAARNADRESKYTFRNSLDLELRSGEVAKFALESSATATDGDEQACHLGNEDLERAASSGGLLLETGTERPRCTVRVMRAGAYLYVAVGDANEEGNDCRMLEDTAFCSPRAFWTDLVLDTKSGDCKPVK